MPRKNVSKNHQQRKGKGKKNVGMNHIYEMREWDQDSLFDDDDDSYYPPYEEAKNINTRNQAGNGFDFLDFQDDIDN